MIKLTKSTLEEILAKILNNPITFEVNKDDLIGAEEIKDWLNNIAEEGKKSHDKIKNRKA